jgi:hypothetical protein
LDARATAGPLRLVGRASTRAETVSSVSLTFRHATVAAGGIRAAHGLGLVLGGGAAAADAVAFPRAQALEPSIARAPWLRGIAAGGAAGWAYAGAGREGPLRAAVLGYGRQRRIAFARVEEAGATASGVFAVVPSPAGRAGVEVARGREGIAAAIACEARSDDAVLAARIDDAPLPPTSSDPSRRVAAALLRARIRRTAAAAEIVSRVRFERGSGGTRTLLHAHALEWTVRHTHATLEGTASLRTARKEVLDLAAPDLDHEAARALALRARPAACAELAIECRMWHDRALDRAWQVALHRGRGSRSLTVALATFATTRSRAVGLPFAGAGLSSRVRGRGARFAAGAACAMRGVELRLAASASAGPAWSTAFQATLALRRP